MLFGMNPKTPFLKTMLNLDGPEGNYPTGRFRDIYLSKNGTRILLYTRNGGGNRDCWRTLADPECHGGGNWTSHSPGCMVWVNNNLKQHPLYVKDYDDSFDCTYAYFEFRVPERFLAATQAMARAQGDPKNVTEKFEEIIAEMKAMPKEEFESDPRFKSVVETLKKIVNSDTQVAAILDSDVSLAKKKKKED